MSRLRARRIPLLAVVVAVIACARPAIAAGLVPVAPPPDLARRCDDLDASALADAIDREAEALRQMPASAALKFGRRVVRPVEYAEKTLAVLARVARAGNAALCRALATRFQFFRHARAASTLFTAYYHPVFRGSRTRTDRFRFPLYRRPPEALAHLSTAQILDGALAGRGLEIAWLADETEAMSAHVEGSVSVELDGGAVLDLGTNGHNGHPYRNVSCFLLADRRIPRDQETPAGMTRARKWFLDHPSEIERYWARNPHFVFFRETSVRGSGRFGALEAGRSIAIDPAVVPMGAAVWLQSEKLAPEAIADGGAEAWVPFGRVALAQDTGSGIRGPGRVDVFFGSGDYAAAVAAKMSRTGRLYVLLAR